MLNSLGVVGSVGAWVHEWRGSKVGVGGVIVPTEFKKLFFIILDLFSASFMKIKLIM